MFKAPFSFEGRIRRTEYGLSILIYGIVITLFNAMIATSPDGAKFLLVLLIPLLWFMWAQGAKRCHDLGNSGWWQLIPFYGFWMLFQEGSRLSNQYGENPKQPSFRRQAIFDEPTGENNTSGNPDFRSGQQDENGQQ